MFKVLDGASVAANCKMTGHLEVDEDVAATLGLDVRRFGTPRLRLWRVARWLLATLVLALFIVIPAQLLLRSAVSPRGSAIQAAPAAVPAKGVPRADMAVAVADAPSPSVASEGAAKAPTRALEAAADAARPWRTARASQPGKGGSPRLRRTASVPDPLSLMAALPNADPDAAAPPRLPPAVRSDRVRNQAAMDALALLRKQ